jgi:hypothetical protein
MKQLIGVDAISGLRQFRLQVIVQLNIPKFARFFQPVFKIGAKIRKIPATSAFLS